MSTTTPDAVEDDVPDGFYWQGSTLMAECPVCERAYEWPGDPEDIDDGALRHCGSTPWCCP